MGCEKNFELRYISEFNLSNSNIQFNNEALGFKISLFEEKGILPKTALIAHYHLNDLKRDNAEFNRTPHSVADFVFTSQNSLSNTISIGYNYGVEFHSNGKHEGIIRVAPGVAIGNNFYFYTEAFGRFPTLSKEHVWVDAGIAYYFNEDLKIDFSSGRSVMNAGEHYIAVGISFRKSLKK